jgi:hypothetical protein
LTRCRGLCIVYLTLSSSRLSHDAFPQIGVSGTPDISSSVHPHEISDSHLDFLDELEDSRHECELDASHPYQHFRHSGWQRLREKVYDAMAATGATAKTLCRFKDCGSFARLYQHETTGDFCVIGNFCRSRFCVPCSTARSHLLQRNLTDFIKRKRVRFLTITIRHHGEEPLNFLIDRFWKSFKLLRKYTQWGQKVTGFAMFVETKWSDRTKGWHVHGHCLCEGSYWDQKEISQLWHASTGDSFIVDIQAKGTPEQMAYYGAKYATKPLNAADMGTPARLCEAIKCTRGRHLYLIGGNWQGKLKLDAKPKLDAGWHDVGSVDALWNDADDGAEAACILRSIITRDRSTLPITEHAQPPP